MKDFDNILVIDTVGERAMVALNGQIVSWEAKRNHSDQLLENVDALLKSQKLSPQNLSGVVVAVGPSTSFTGVRVGITVANGIGFGLNIPVAGVSEFELIRTRYKSEWVVVDAKRDEVFFEYQKTQGLMSLEDLAKKIKKGEAVHMPAGLVKTGFATLHKAGTVYMYEMPVEERAAAMLQAAKLPKKYQQVLPVYLRGANISKPKVLKPN